MLTRCPSSFSENLILRQFDYIFRCDVAVGHLQSQPASAIDAQIKHIKSSRRQFRRASISSLGEKNPELTEIESYLILAQIHIPYLAQSTSSNE
ncbi:hypothetical protein DL98DRAFT_517276 [Cadophora sp. DSE1049]|nr:hypothetical protein DL98DRAFT_517276 [Cadophora sp. DSE1049]